MVLNVNKKWENFESTVKIPFEFFSRLARVAQKPYSKTILQRNKAIATINQAARNIIQMQTRVKLFWCNNEIQFRELK